jgi:TPP-dependent pyruvate/acetoin dehydrogenase alpha subunit
MSAETLGSETAVERRKKLHAGLKQQYERMVEIRTIENNVNDLFASGVIHGTTHLCVGQEALDVGIALALERTDIVTATYRSHGIALALGMTPVEVMGEIMGKEVGCTGGVGGSMHLCDMSVGLLPTFAIVGAGYPVAAGAALAFQNLGQSHVALAMAGDGSTNIGAFHESLNLAAIWKLPVIFVVDNNVYGEYSRIETTTPIEDLHTRAASYDIPGIVVDGMDVRAVQAVVATAAKRARAGEGPSLIEAKTYRFSGHSRADTAPYRPEGELESWLDRDPLKVTRELILSEGVMSQIEIDQVTTDAENSVTELIGYLSTQSEPGLGSMFTNIWATENKVN